MSAHDQPICCVVAGTTADGSPGFYLTKVRVTRDEYNDGVHYDRAKAAAELHGYEPPFVAFDEFDRPDALFSIFDWKTVEELSDADMSDMHNS